MVEIKTFWLKDDAPKGVYILTCSQKCVLPEYWYLHNTEEVQGIAVIDKCRLVVAMDGISNLSGLLERNVLQNNKQYPSIEGIDYAGGKEDTLLLAGVKSEAADLCLNYFCGGIVKGQWYLPSIGELAIMAIHKRSIDFALLACGGMPIDTDRKLLSSTRKSDRENWIMDWNDGYISWEHQVFLYRIRPVSTLK